MKAKELRIGNLVHFNGNHKEVGVVSEILKNDLTKVSPYKIGINHRTDIYYDIDKLKPIPITKEWLLKFGFSDKVDFFTIKDMISFSKDLNRTYLMLDNIIKKIEHVHQLQNLYFALTNEELL